MIRLFFIENAPPPKPPDAKRGRPKTVYYPFAEIPVGGAARCARTRVTVLSAMYRFLKTPEGQGMQFTVRAINPRLTRIWRDK